MFELEAHRLAAVAIQMMRRVAIARLGSLLEFLILVNNLDAMLVVSFGRLVADSRKMTVHVGKSYLKERSEICTNSKLSIKGKGGHLPASFEYESKERIGINRVV